MATITKCECGRRMNKHLNKCSTCHLAASKKRYEEARKVVATGQCPICSSKLRRNLSLTGWWQCEQLGADTHRARPEDPSCTFQVFTE